MSKEERIEYATWEADTAALLDRITEQLGQLQAGCGALVRQRDALNAALAIYRAVVQPVDQPSQPDVVQLDPKAIAGMSHRAILRLIASRNNNILVGKDAIRAMIAAGVLDNPDHAAGTIYCALSRSPEFVKVQKGIYCLVEQAP